MDGGRAVGYSSGGTSQRGERIGEMSIRFKTNIHKALEVILWFANQRNGIDFHAILKLLFFAEKLHINQYGRPIVGDSYKALPYGPVGQTTYDLLKLDPLALESLQLDEETPFSVQGGHHVHPKRPPNLARLSESDVEALESVWATYGGRSFKELTDLSHAHPAYRRAQAADRRKMLYEDFLEGDAATEARIADLAAVAPRMRI